MRIDLPLMPSSAESKIKHCRIAKEGRMYCIGDAEFESLVKMVEYFEKHTLYRKMKLKYPVDWTLIERQVRILKTLHGADSELGC